MTTRRRLVRVEVYPNPLNATHAGDYAVPVYAVIRATPEGIGEVEERGKPVYFQTTPLPPEVALAFHSLADTERRMKPIVEKWFFDVCLTAHEEKPKLEKP